MAIHGHPEGVALWERKGLAVAQRFVGPALIVEQVSTTWLAPDWHCTVDPHGNLLLERD